VCVCVCGCVRACVTGARAYNACVHAHVLNWRRVSEPHPPITPNPHEAAVRLGHQPAGGRERIRQHLVHARDDTFACGPVFGVGVEGLRVQRTHACVCVGLDGLDEQGWMSAWRGAHAFRPMRLGPCVQAPALHAYTQAHPHPHTCTPALRQQDAHIRQGLQGGLQPRRCRRLCPCLSVPLPNALKLGVQRAALLHAGPHSLQPLSPLHCLW